MMFRSSLLAACLVLISCATSVFAQPTQSWIDRVNGNANSNDNVRGMAADPAGNIYVTGWTSIALPDVFSPQAVIVKYSPTGTRLWLRNFAIGNHSVASCIAHDPVGGGAVVGGRNDISNVMFVLKYDASGALTWSRTFTTEAAGGSIVPSAIEVDTAGNVWISISDGLDGIPAAKILKYSPGGQLLMSIAHTGGLDGGAGVNDIEVDSATGELYITGSQGLFGMGDGVKMAVTKFSAAGSHLWTRTAGHLGPFFTNSGDQIIRDPVGNLIAGGTFGGNSLTRDIGVTKISPDGAVFWTRTFDGAAHKGDDFFALAHHAGTGDVLVVGDTERSDGSGDPLIYRLDAHGNTLWSRTLGLANTTYDTVRDVTVDSAGNAYAVGKLAASTGGNWALTVKYAPDGATLWEDRYLGPTGGSSDWRHVLLTNASGPAPTIHTSGDSFGSGTGQDLTTRQLTQPAPPPPPCMGDADGDLTVAFGDITSVLANFGASYPPGTSGAGDANFDDVVDFLDVTTVLANFETSCQ